VRLGWSSVRAAAQTLLYENVQVIHTDTNTHTEAVCVSPPYIRKVKTAFTS